jgi:hypothetical protein
MLGVSLVTTSLLLLAVEIGAAKGVSAFAAETTP